MTLLLQIRADKGVRLELGSFLPKPGFDSIKFRWNDDRTFGRIKW